MKKETENMLVGETMEAVMMYLMGDMKGSDEYLRRKSAKYFKKFLFHSVSLIFQFLFFILINMGFGYNFIVSDSLWFLFGAFVTCILGLILMYQIRYDLISLRDNLRNSIYFMAVLSKLKKGEDTFEMTKLIS